ncbi:MAG: hypothetical protein V3W44_05080 [Dehalococcoidales bacterium]
MSETKDVPEAQDYGEPWGMPYQMRAIVSKRGRPVVGFGPEGLQFDCDANRIIACVNALAGCPDPKAFVEAVREILPNFCYAARRDEKTDQLNAALNHPSITWLREVKS